MLQICKLSTVKLIWEIQWRFESQPLKLGGKKLLKILNFLFKNLYNSLFTIQNTWYNGHFLIFNQIRKFETVCKF